MEIKIRSDNSSAKIISTLVIENNESEPIGFYLFVINKTISSVFVYDPIGPLQFTWSVKPDSNILNITMRYPLLESQKYVFSVSYEVYDVIYFSQEPLEYFSLEYNILHNMATDHFILEISLPLNYILIDSDSPRPTYPSPTRIYTDEEIVKIVWELENAQLYFEYLYIVRYQQMIKNTITTIIEPQNQLFWLFILIGFIIGVGLSILTFIFIVKKKLQPDKSEIVSSLLSEAEQIVLRAITDEGGVAIQRRICERTSYSKSKVSQILLKLEEKNVLKRERWGRTNRVSITNSSFLKLDLEDYPEKIDDED
ncbi:MAG: winged helix DNA-binding protein [Asgard group archaeon]|nr:winged helix DNA-binding protein [Asgard group archaeon]